MRADDSTHAKTNAEFGRGARRPRGRMDPRAAPRVRGEDPPWQVHRFDEHTIVLRQSRQRCTSAGHVPQAAGLTSWPLTPRTQWVKRAVASCPAILAACGRHQSLMQQGAQPTGARRERFPRRLWQSRSFRP